MLLCETAPQTETCMHREGYCLLALIVGGKCCQAAFLAAAWLARLCCRLTLVYSAKPATEME